MPVLLVNAMRENFKQRERTLEERRAEETMVRALRRVREDTRGS